MEIGDILIMVASMLASFLLGMVGMLFFAGRTTLNYIVVKASRGRKVLIFARTPFGWRSFVGKKNQNTLEWSYDKKPLVTDIEVGDVNGYLRADCLFVDADKPTKALKVSEGAFYPDDFDPETFNNLLIRALTRPNADGNDKLEKLVTVALVLLVLAVLGILATYIKVSGFVSSTGVVI